MSSVDARIHLQLPSERESPAFDLDVHITAGAGITVILGPSGSGKTLTLNCIAGFARPQEGRILVDDQIYFDAPSRLSLAPEHRRCGYIFQDHALFPHMTIRENLRFAASLAKGHNGALNSHRRVQELLQSFELNDLAERKPAQLSGGQKQRAAIARTMVTNPLVLLLDEPARGLDERLRQNFYALLEDLRTRLDIPVLLVSHHLEDCYTLADSVLLLANGRIMQAGPKDTVLRKPASVDAARSLGVFNTAEAEITSLNPEANTSRIRVFGQEIEGPYLPGHLIGDRGYVCLPRSEVRLANRAASQDVNCLRLPLVAQTPAMYGVRLSFENDFVVMASRTESTSSHTGDLLMIEFPKAMVSFLTS